MYAAGKIPGGFFKREGRPTERAILTARMIDRPIRPLWPKGFRNEVQCIATVLSADMVTPHDILAINGISAALMVSPLPFLGPIGAVRIGLLDGELVVNPTLAESEQESELDLIVVGTKEGLTMVEAGANQVPEAKLLEALELAHREIVKICEAQEELRARAGKAKWLDQAVTDELIEKYGHEIWQRIQDRGLTEAGAIVEEIVARESGPLTMTSTEADVQRELQVRMSLQLILEKQRSAAAEAPVREQFESELRALTESEQDSKELKSAKQHLLYERIVETADLPFPVVAGGRGGRRPRLAHEALRRRRRRSRSTRTSSARRSPSRSVARTAAPRRRSARSPARSRVSPRTHGSGALHPRPDADHVAAHPRHRQGGPADRRPLAREGPPLHPPLQLPAVLGRRDGPDDRPAPPRHRPRRARPAGARGGHPGSAPTSRTRSASSPRRSSRTAPRRWARCAARRSR